MELVKYEKKNGTSSNIHLLNLKEAKKVQAFHQSFPQYEATPLVSLDHYVNAFERK